MSAVALAALWLSAECGAPGPLATSPCIVAPGHVQIEGDFVSARIARHGASSARSLDLGPLVVKVPLSRALQIEGMVGPLDIRRGAQQDGGHGTRLDEIAGWLKLNVLLSSRWSAALRPGIELTPGDRRDIRFVLGLPLAVALPAQWSLTLDPELEKELTAAEPGFQSLIALSRPVGPRWTGLVEVLSTRAAGSASPIQHQAVLGLDYETRGSVPAHLDIGGGVGVNRAARGCLAYIGYSVRL